jgi:signal transduction histidine kinase
MAGAVDALLARMCAALDLSWAGVWLHDRRAGVLLRVTSRGDREPSLPDGIPTGDAGGALAAALRAARPVVLPSRGGACGDLLLAPLRGRRRALGVLALRPSRVSRRRIPSRELQPFCDSLASAIENIQLLDDVLRARRELEHVFDALTELVVVFDGRGRIVHANRALAGRLGAAPRALADAPLPSQLGPGLSAWIAAQACGEPGTSATTRIADARLGGLFEVRLTVLEPMVAGPTAAGASGGARVLVARDVSADAAHEAERRELESRLRRSEQLLALGRFVAGVAHELNNPLQGVLGHLELLRRTRALPAALDRDLATIHREAGRAARIVRNLLLFAGSGRLRRRTLSVNALVERVLRAHAGSRRRQGIRVVRRLSARAPRVSGDAVLLQQAVDNVAVNAAQAMPGGGTLTVCTSESRGVVKVTIEDTGPGLSPEVEARLFEPFVTTREIGRGTGLGLAMVFGILQAHGGSVAGCNRAGGGARFTMTLPAGAGRGDPPNRRGAGRG